MRGDDDFRRGAFGEDGSSGDERTSPDLTPAAGRDNIQMFWEQIGMKPGDDWKKHADDAPGDAKDS
ncbi:MAG: hypothetical protein ACOZEN_15380 [Thermodesulfobacteriota bacterium]|jgi:hypothetical protein